MTLRVCIPTAGTGSRLLGLTRYLNKSLVAIANRPTLSHLIEQFPDDTEFVLALGHKGELVRQFVALAYPHRRFFFADVTPFEGPGSGLGLSMLACRAHLQQPFIFLSCDTLVREAIPAPERNWVGCAATDQLAPYRSIAVSGGSATAICEKGEGQSTTHQAYIGLAGIHDYAAFWRAMEDGGDTAIATGEAYGLRTLLDGGMDAHTFTWFDTGNPDALARAQAAYQEADAPNILPKENEAIWFVGDQAIKFSDDENFIANRARRAGEIAQFVPELVGVSKNMYAYKKVEGEVLSACVTIPLFARLLDHSAEFWKPAALDTEGAAQFRAQCMKFYRNKTLERVALYYSNFKTEDGAEPINGVAMPTLAALLDKVDWDSLADGMAGRFHGDFHFENILFSETSNKFTFLDWRQDFGGSISVGDAYYDFAKLLHGLIICHELIAQDLYEVERVNAGVQFDFHRKQVLVECERHFLQWLGAQGYDASKVQVLTALIYLNIAALHHAPYCHLLYYLGKSMLHDALNNPA